MLDSPPGSESFGENIRLGRSCGKVSESEIGVFSTSILIMDSSDPEPEKATKDNDKEFGPVVTLKLLSIGMLKGVSGNSYDFGSLKKKRMVGEKK